jgi:hypothetical protein
MHNNDADVVVAQDNTSLKVKRFGTLDNNGFVLR